MEEQHKRCDYRRQPRGGQCGASARPPRRRWSVTCGCVARQNCGRLRRQPLCLAQQIEKNRSAEVNDDKIQCLVPVIYESCQKCDI
jgi:hypothetical protein